MSWPVAKRKSHYMQERKNSGFGCPGPSDLQRHDLRNSGSCKKVPGQ